MNNLKTRRLVITSLLSAIIIVMTFVPQVGYISYGMLSITLLHIPVIIGAIILGPIDGTVLGFVWGITCLLKAFTMPIEGQIFLNPLISVLPRVLVGLIVGLLAKYALDKFKNKTVAYISCAVVGTLSNTVLVLTAIGLFAGDTIAPIGQTLLTIIKIAVSLNGSIELLCAAVLVPIITTAVVKSLK